MLNAARKNPTPKLVFAFCAVVAGLLASLAWPMASWAQSWPQRTVRFVVSQGAGSAQDIGARLFAEQLSKRWGQSVVIENRPGADGINAINDLRRRARQPHLSVHGIRHLHRSSGPARQRALRPARPRSDREGVDDDYRGGGADRAQCQHARRTGCAGAPGSRQAQSRAHARDHRDRLRQLPECRQHHHDQDSVQRHHQGADGPQREPHPGDRVGDRGGEIAWSTPARSGCLAITNLKRTPVAPDLPTAIEAGYPALALDGLIGLFGPRSLPASVVERIAADVLAAAEDPAIAKRLAATGQQIDPARPGRVRCGGRRAAAKYRCHGQGPRHQACEIAPAAATVLMYRRQAGMHEAAGALRLDRHGHGVRPGRHRRPPKTPSRARPSACR